MRHLGLNQLRRFFWKSLFYAYYTGMHDFGKLEQNGCFVLLYSARNLEMSIRFSLKSRPSERFHRPEMSQIKAEISLRTNVKLIFHKNVGLK